MKRDLLLSLPICALLSVTGCGGTDSRVGGNESGVTTYAGNQELAGITEVNAEQLSRSATEGIAHAAMGSDVPALPIGVQINSSRPLTEALVITMLPYALEGISSNSLPGAFQQTMPCSLSGSVLITADGDVVRASNFGTTVPESGTLTLGFQDCRDDRYIVPAATMDGIATITFTGAGSFNSVFQDFTVTYSDPVSGAQIVENIENLTLSCGDFQDMSSCRMESDFIGSDGKTYRISDVVINGDESAGYDLSAKVYDAELGFVLIEALSMILDCPSGMPGSGSLSLTGANDALVTVEYTSCSEFETCFAGVCNLAAW